MTLKSLKSRSKVEKETLVTLAWCIQLEGFCLMFWAFFMSCPLNIQTWTRHNTQHTTCWSLLIHWYIWRPNSPGAWISRAKCWKIRRTMAAVPALIFSNHVNLIHNLLHNLFSNCRSFISVSSSFFGPFSQALAVVVSLWASRRFTSFCFVSAPPKLPTPIEERGKDGLLRWHVGEV